MIKTKKNKSVYIIYLLVCIVLFMAGIWLYRSFFSPEATIKQYLINQFNYDAASIEEMQLRRERFLSRELLLKSEESGETEVRRVYAAANGEHCSLQSMKVEKKEKGLYTFEVWYYLRYDSLEVEDKCIHVCGTMEMSRNGGLLKKISSIKAEHSCEENMEKE
ncbi:MAG: hypothetical protein ACI4QX_09225 [Lachnospiraceae bacterium]